MRTVGVGDGHYGAVAGGCGGYNGGEAILAIGTSRTLRARFTLRSLRTRRAACAVQAVGHRKGGDGAVRIMDGVGIDIADAHRAEDVGDAASVRAVSTRRTDRTLRTLGTLWTLDALLSVVQHKGVRTVGVGDGHYGAVAGGCGGYNGGEAILAIGTSRTLRARFTLRSLRTRRAACAVQAVGHRKGGDGAVRIMDGVGIDIADAHRAEDVGDAASVRAVSTRRTDRTLRTLGTLWTLDALLSIVQHKGMRTVGVSDGHYGAVGSGCGGNNGREAILAISTSRTLRARFTLRSLRTRRAVCSGCAVGYCKRACCAIGIGDGVGVGQSVGHRTDDIQDATPVSSRCAGGTRSTRGTVIAINAVGHSERGGGGVGVDNSVGIHIAVGGGADNVRDAATVRAGCTGCARSPVVAVCSIRTVGNGKG